MSGLIQTGQFHEQQGLDTLGTVAAMQQKRETLNKQIEAQEKQSTMAAVGTGAAVGAQVGGPWGALLGGFVGLLGSYAF